MVGLNRSGYFVETKQLAPNVMKDFLESIKGVVSVDYAYDPTPEKQKTTDAFEVIVKNESDLERVGDTIFNNDNVISGLKL